MSLRPAYLQSKFQVSQGYAEKPYLETPKPNQNNNNTLKLFITTNSQRSRIIYRDNSIISLIRWSCSIATVFFTCEHFFNFILRPACSLETRVTFFAQGSAAFEQVIREPWKGPTKIQWLAQRVALQLTMSTWVQSPQKPRFCACLPSLTPHH